MNVNEFKDLNNDWEMEFKRRMRHHRRRVMRDAMRSARAEIAIMVALVIGFLVFLVWWNRTQPLRDRAAYLEGREGIDHQEALRMAEYELKCEKWEREHPSKYPKTGWVAYAGSSQEERTARRAVPTGTEAR